MKPTLETVKKMASAPETIKAAEELFEAMAAEQVVREVIQPEQERVLSEIGAVTEEGNPILTNEQAYQLNDKEFKTYMDEMHKVYLANGFEVEYEYCPLLIAESNTRDKETALCEAVAPYTGITKEDIFCSRNSLEKYKSYLDLNLKVFAPIVKELRK